MKAFILSIVMILFCLSLSAQDNNNYVRGSVHDKQSRSPLVGASITVVYGDKTGYAICDTSGNFEIQITTGRCDIYASYIGYKPEGMKNVMVYSGKETVVEFFLEEQVLEMGGIVVVAGDKKGGVLNEMATSSARILSAEEANRYAGSWNDPARMASSFAGVAAANDSRNDIVVRGNSPIGVQWRIDGFEIANPNHFGSMGGSGGNVGMINNNQLRNSDFYSGAFPAEFGNLTSGLFDLRLRNGNSQKREYMFSLGFNGFELGAEGGFSKKSRASYLINARYSFLDILKMLGLDIAAARGGVPKYWDVSAKLDFPMNKSNLSIILMPGHSKISYKEDVGTSSSGVQEKGVSMANRQYFIGVNYTYRFSNNVRLENRVSYQMFNTETAVDKITYTDMSLSTEKFYNSDFDEKRVSYSSRYVNKINSRNSVLAGIGADFYNTSLEDHQFHDQTPTLLHDEKNNNSILFQAFAQWQYRFNDKLSIFPGIHGTLFSLNKDYGIEPRLGLKWSINEKATVGFSSGLYSQLQPRLVYFYQEDGRRVNEDVKMTKSFQSALNVEYLLAPSLRLKAEVYYQLLYKVPVIKEIPQESMLNKGDDYYNDWDHKFVNKGKGYNYGVELTLEKFFDKQFYFLLTASLYDSKYRGYDNVLRNTKFNGNYAFNFLGGYEIKIFKRSLMSFNLKMSYIGNKRYTPTSSDNGLDMVVDYENINSIKLPDYFRMDLNVNVKTNFKRCSVEYFVEIDNLTNQKNVWQRYYNTNQKKDIYTYQQALLPMGGVRVYF